MFIANARELGCAPLSLLPGPHHAIFASDDGVTLALKGTEKGGRVTGGIAHHELDAAVWQHVENDAGG
jgi:hypothetical protein